MEEPLTTKQISIIKEKLQIAEVKNEIEPANISK
jgi:hypothetical protein